MTVDNIPPIAKRALEDVAKEFGVDMDAILDPWPRTGRARAARTKAVGRLDQMRVRGTSEPFFALTELQKIFGVSRASIARLRSAASGYRPRRQRKPLTNETS